MLSFFLMVDDQPEKGGNTQGVKNGHISGSEQVGKYLFSSARMSQRLSPGSGLEVSLLHIFQNERKKRIVTFLSITGAIPVVKTDHIATPDTLHGLDGIDRDDHDESENFSDIDDVEVCYFLYICKI